LSISQKAVAGVVLATRKDSLKDLIENSVGYGLSHHNRSQPWYFQHDNIMDINVVIFTLSALVWHIQGHRLHPYIMVDAAVPWFDPIPPIGRQGTQKWLTTRCG
jgi:hypothetical protein